jgi:hypothetical protein
MAVTGTETLQELSIALKGNADMFTATQQLTYAFHTTQ